MNTQRMTGWEADGPGVPLTQNPRSALAVGLTLTQEGFVPAFHTLLPHHTMEAFSWIIPNLAAPQEPLLSLNRSKSQTPQLHKSEELFPTRDQILTQKV